ncbi:MAG: UDP-N-acetylmuramoyl-tripeptide--D-alanyl-D-alanine ligase [Ignavibacteria bacterium]
MKLSPSELLHITHDEFCNIGKLKGEMLRGVSTDSRTIREGELFVALRGTTYDGHRFLADAFARGALAAVVARDGLIEPVKTMPLLVVPDTTNALGELARYYRLKFSIPVLAIGGSNGKTTTKDMIAAVLGRRFKVLSTEGNLNNQIGVPHTLFRLDKKHDIAVIEIGTNHPGEIAYLCGIVEPTHGLITNIGREHLEFFRSLGGVAKEEGALFEKLARNGGTAFVNVDDVHLRRRSQKIKSKVTYGFSSRTATVRGRLGAMDAAGCVELHFVSKRLKRETRVKLAIPGKHSAANALAAAAVGLTFHVPAAEIKFALEYIQPVNKRMEILTINGITVYNDTYNANPDSMRAALQTLAAAQVSGKRIAVLADMNELGAASETEHTRIGKEIISLQIDYLLTFGDQAQYIYEAANMKFKCHYQHKNMLAEYLSELLAPGDAVLVKGSRSMKMEDVVVFLQERLKQTKAPA